jgi:ketosteroid isomerase-like protein
MTEQRARNVRSLERLYETINQGGLEAVHSTIEDICHPDVEFSPIFARELEGRTFRGFEQVVSFLDDLGRHFEAVRYDPVEVEALRDDVVIARVTLVGSGRGSGAPVALDMAMVCEFDAGRLRRAVVYRSGAEAMDAARELADA